MSEIIILMTSACFKLTGAKAQECLWDGVMFQDDDLLPRIPVELCLSKLDLCFASSGHCEHILR
jgi:hypothetical protein